jgi:8-oxo-dGTP diphosphatase
VSLWFFIGNDPRALKVKTLLTGVLTDEVGAATVSTMEKSPNSPREITVVAAVIQDAEGKVLLTQRPQDRHMGGLWEFPGGKIDDGEAPSDALVRELDEELGIEIEIQRPLTFAVHEEPGLRILLLFFSAQIASGEPLGHEGQAVEWVAVTELTTYPTPPADAELVRQLVDGGVLDPGRHDDLPLSMKPR